MTTDKLPPVKTLRKILRNVRLSMPTKQKKIQGKAVDYFSGARLVDHIIENIHDGNNNRSVAAEVAKEFLRQGALVRAEFTEKPAKGKDGQVKPNAMFALCDIFTLEAGKKTTSNCSRSTDIHAICRRLYNVVLVGSLTTIPVWPYTIRSVVQQSAWYLSMVLLVFLLLVFGVRYIVHILIYLGSRRKYDFWIFPNINDEKLGFFDSFKPLFEWETLEPNQRRSKKVKEDCRTTTDMDDDSNDKADESKREDINSRLDSAAGLTDAAQLSQQGITNTPAWKDFLLVLSISNSTTYQSGADVLQDLTTESEGCTTFAPFFFVFREIKVQVASVVVNLALMVITAGVYLLVFAGMHANEQIKGNGDTLPHTHRIVTEDLIGGCSWSLAKANIDFIGQCFQKRLKL
eukprot:gene1054-4286_t